jgi:hypothetical protein
MRNVLRLVLQSKQIQHPCISTTFVNRVAYTRVFSQHLRFMSGMAENQDPTILEKVKNMALGMAPD